MPKVVRFSTVAKGSSFTLTAKQYDFLKKKSFKASDNYREAATEKSLIGRKLFARRNGSLVRTKLGDEVLSLISTRIRKAAKESAK